MMKNATWSNRAANAAMDAVASALNGGTLNIYSGKQPASPDAPITTQVLIATLKLGSPAFKPATGGVAVAYPITPEPDAKDSGVAVWYRVRDALGVADHDGSVGTSDANLELNTTNLVQHSEVLVLSFQLTALK